MSASSAQVAAAVQALMDEGAGPGNSIHSWRCEHPDRYGPCDCVAETAKKIAAAVVAAGPAVSDGLSHGETWQVGAVSDGEGATSEAEPDPELFTPDGTTRWNAALVLADRYAATRPASPVVAPSATDEGGA